MVETLGGAGRGAAVAVGAGGRVGDAGAFARPAAQRGVDGAGALGAFGGVLGDVAGHRLIGQLLVAAECVDGTDVQLLAPADLTDAAGSLTVRAGGDGPSDR